MKPPHNISQGSQSVFFHESIYRSLDEWFLNCSADLFSGTTTPSAVQCYTKKKLSRSSCSIKCI